MHICFITHEYPLPGRTHGGIGSFVQTLSAELVKLGHRISVVGSFSSKDETINDEGVNVYLLKHSSWKVARFYDNGRKVTRLIKRVNLNHPIDVIESPEIALAFLKKIPSISHVIRLHGGHHFFTTAEKKPLNPWKAYQEKRSFKKADYFVAVSHFVASETRQLLPIKKEVKVIYNTLNVDRFPQADARKIFRNRLLFFGTVCEKKGVRQLVQAIPKVKKSFPDVQLIIAGRDKQTAEGSYINYLKGLIDSSITNNIHFLGEIPHEQIAFELQKAEVCILPSHMEALGIAWLEALAMGKPFIGSIMGPGREIILEGKTGLLADPFNPDDIADKIIELLSDKQKALEMGTAARQDILQRFDFKKTVLDNVSFYQQLINL